MALRAYVANGRLAPLVALLTGLRTSATSKDHL